MDNINVTFRFFDLLSVYTQDKNSDYSTDEIDEAILYALLKAQKSIIKSEEIQEAKKSQLNLALTWDRVDMAKKFIFSENTEKWETESLLNFMYMAVKQNKVEFVRLFLQQGFILPKFLTNRCLLKLYNDVRIGFKYGMLIFSRLI